MDGENKGSGRDRPGRSDSSLCGSRTTVTAARQTQLPLAPRSVHLSLSNPAFAQSRFHTDCWRKRIEIRQTTAP
ncbi:hypothetical protein EYF80_049654 [Liparis tanakae]|uniref:Uncharacterized protein n=1 Tax=Liparis tanakae TaxID=230148 RepID=A0A4Z2FGX2_9TELE|nr:hypothetical protein EYF80_049654 [Liparis tanakae]